MKNESIVRALTAAKEYLWNGEDLGREGAGVCPYPQSKDLAALTRFRETTDDGQSYDIGKDACKRLADLGCLQSHGFGRYSVTSFGDWVLAQEQAPLPAESAQPSPAAEPVIKYVPINTMNEREAPRIVEKANCITVCIGNAVVGSFAGRDCDKHAETFRAALSQPAIEDLCSRIKAADDAAADSDYMLDSNDCIAVLRGTWKGPMAMDKPEKPTKQPSTQAGEAMSDQPTRACAP